jgi:hypothetical protein
MSRSHLLAVGLAVSLSATPAAGGVWFDIGGGQPVTISANSAVETQETYRAFAFGQFPPGSLVFEDISVRGCDALGEPDQICGETRFVRGFELYFYGVSCGCGGALVLPSQLRFGYDPLVVMATRATEENLKLFFRDEDITNWTLVPGAVLDTENNWFTVSWDRSVLGTRQFAILTHDITPVTSNTWGRIKTLYRH